MKKRHFRFLTMLMTASMLASALPVYAQDRPAEAVIEAESVEDGCTDETEDPAGDVVVEMPEDDGVVEGDYELKVLDEDAKTARITKYLGSGTGDMTIPATLGDYSIIEIGNSAFKGIEMTSVKIPETIMSIGTYAFADCKMLQEVTVISGSTDLEMDYNTFSNCVRLKKITLSDRVKSIPREFAYQDELLEEVVWPATLTSIGSNAFYGDKLLVSSDLSGTKLATIGESAFNGCTAFPLVKLPAEGSLIIKEHAFDGTSMKDGDKDGELLISANVTEIGNYAFDETKYLGSVTFAEGSSEITLGYNTFSESARLKKITLSDRVKTLPTKFAYLDKLLEEVVWPAALTTIGADAFYGDVLLVSSDLSCTRLATIGESAFKGCTAFPLVKFPTESTLIIKEHAFDGTSMKDGDKDGELFIPANVAELGNYVFDECPDLGSVTFAEGSSEVILGYNTFSNCARIKKITLSDRVKSLPTKFAYLDKLLEEVVWPAALTSIGSDAFYGDILLTSSDLSGTRLATIGESAFKGCKIFPLVKFPTGSSLIIKEHAFDETSMKDGDKDGELFIPANVSDIGNYAFDECSDLGSVTLEEGSSAVGLGYNIFSNCDHLTVISLGNRCRTITSQFAYNCPALIQLIGGTGITEIKSGAFYINKDAEIVLTDCQDVLKNYDWAKDNRQVVTAAAIVILEKEYTVETGKSLNLEPKITVVPEGAATPALVWKSSSDTYVKVDKNGKVTGKKQGNATITVSSTGGILKGSCNVIVTKKGEGPAPAPEKFIPVEGSGEAMDSQPEINESTKDIYLVQGQKFTVPNGKYWKSGDSKMLSISKSGIVNAKKKGTTTLTYGDMEPVNVYICKPEISNKKLNLKAGETGSAGLINAENMNVLWVSSALDVATVDEDGMITAVAKGSAKITAYINGKAYNCTVKVKEEEACKERSLHINVGGKKTISIKGQSKLKWTVSGNETAVKLNGKNNNKVTGMETGETTLIADDFIIHVYVDDPTIIGNDGVKKPYKKTVNLKVGEEQMLELTSMTYQKAVFKSNKNAVAYINEDGNIIARGKGTAKLTAKVNGKTLTVTVKVTN